MMGLRQAILVALFAECLFGKAQTITTVVGTGIQGYSGDSGMANVCEINNPTCAIFDFSNKMYIADYGNNVIRQIDISSIVSTIGGTGVFGFSGDGGPVSNATFMSLDNLAFGSNGNIYIVDGNNARIRKVDSSKNISTIAGNGTFGFGGDGGPATAAALQPSVVVVDNLGNLFIADEFNNRIRKIDTLGVISTIAGTGSPGYAGDGSSAIFAQFNGPTCIALDPQGNLYVADYHNNRIRKISVSGMVSTIAGTGSSGYSGDGGAAVSATLNGPQYVIWGGGSLFISDGNNHVIRKIDTSNTITTVAGTGAMGYSGDGGPAISAQLNNPAGLSLDNAGNLFICDLDNNRIRMVTNVSGIDELGDKGSLKICPNPASDRIELRGCFSSFEIFNLYGKSLLSGNQKVIDLQGFDNGIYFLEFQTAFGAGTQKVIIQH